METIEQLRQTDLWSLYEICKSYCYRTNMFSTTDKCYRFFNDDQWNGVKLKGIEPVQLNYIKPIVKYKVGTINSNLYAAHFSSENFERSDLRKSYDKICEMLNKKAARIWEKDGLDLKLREISKDSAISSEGVMWSYWDEEKQLPVNEVLSKTDIFFGNENEPDIQRQPYILIKRRMTVLEAKALAEKRKASTETINNITSDKNVSEEAGDSAKIEKDDMVTVITKLYKKDGTVHYEQGTQFATIIKDEDTGLSRYQVSHMTWEDKKGSARGEGEVRTLIPNQIEVNKTIMRRLITVKKTAFPQRVVNKDKIMNPESVDAVGGTIYVKGGQTVDDVNKVFGIVQPSQMSPDVERLMNDLIQVTRELAGAGDIATGEVNPESASGRAILAVKQASEQPLTEQMESLKSFVEDVVRNWLDMMITYSEEGLTLEQTETDMNGEEYTTLVTIPQDTLKELQATVKIDITPKGAFDKYAQELSLENMFKAGMFNIQKLPELKVYVKLLDDDATMPKAKIEEAIQLMEAEQQKIAEINAQAQLMQQRANQFLSNEPETQQAQIMEAEQMVNQDVA